MSSRTWKCEKNPVPAPALPDGFTRLDAAERLKLFEAFAEHVYDAVVRDARDSGVKPDFPATFELLVRLKGTVEGLIHWQAARIDDLSARIDELEKNGIRYMGTWQRAMPYKKGDVVTSASCMWVALKAVPEGAKPGDDPEFWQLSAKRGAK